MATSGEDAPRKPATRLAHSGSSPRSQHGFVNTPVYRGSTVLFPTLAALESKNQPYTYGRRGTPTVRALEQALAELDGGADCRLTPSGYQAVASAILSFVRAGDHILVTDSAYQPTRQFCDHLLSKLGVETEYYDPTIGGKIETLFRPNTRLVHTESPGSQTFEVQDVPAIAKAAKKKEIWVLLDNTWATPLFFRPFDHGVDVSIQSATKYIVGHADAMLGAIVSNERAAKHVERTTGLIGSCPGSEETYLGLRGMRTLDVRLQRHYTSALEIARWLEKQKGVARVIHPALESHPGHAIWKRDFRGASGLFAIVLEKGPKSAVAAMVDGLEFFGMGFSWGGYESLILPFDPSTYRTATKWVAEGPALRIHIGLEDIDDLKRDLTAGLERYRKASA